MLWTQFHTALTFLTRFGNARITSAAQLSSTLAMYPLVGAFIGASLVLAAQIPISPWVRAWCLCALNMYITRGLHWDGWADLWDGWGSGSTGERFWEIVKDSHIGAFGVIGLILGIGLQASLYEAAIAQDAWLYLGWSCMFGRLCCLVLARLGKTLARPGLGQKALEGATTQNLLIALLSTLPVIFFLSVKMLCASLLMAGLAISVLYRMGKAQGAVNGDFLGSAIITGELCALLPLAL